MQEIIKYAQNILKIKNLKAYAIKQNQKAINLYQRHGFKIYKQDNKFIYFCREFK